MTNLEATRKIYFSNPSISCIVVVKLNKGFSLGHHSELTEHPLMDISLP
jgi:hypothetical protein